MKLSAEDANALSMLIDNLELNDWKFTQKDGYPQASAAMLERVQASISALEAELKEARKERDKLAHEHYSFHDRASEATDFANRANQELLEIRNERDTARQEAARYREALETYAKFSEAGEISFVSGFLAQRALKPEGREP